MKKRNQSGFTLIEIAIVLVIIGLLIGGVMKGQELIDSAKVKNLANDFRNTPAFLYSYQDRFRALPGDDAAVVTHLNGTLATTPGTTGNGAIEGGWNSNTPTDESYLFWQHIRLAGLAAGATDLNADNYPPTNADGGRLGIQSNATNRPITDLTRGAYVICADGISGKHAKQLDLQLDDGDTAAGSMMAAKSGNTTAETTATVSDADVYVVCQGV
ncbi:MAG: prepilin-type N-terminal cleavage/methylation domain-containing protein [Gallionellaceae bacterium]|jgi:prepilin-type N-terminal cleavage/methylation domain-containing protein|nr:prepilin-type N-terminal cleavage/methylation domain-containing protein [Gallionellaceae bacterium]